MLDGDTVYYWYMIVVAHHGMQFTDLHWTIGETTPASKKLNIHQS